MTDAIPGYLLNAEKTARRMRAIAEGLTAHGVPAHLHESRAGLDITATLQVPGRRDAQIVIDEDGYAELHYWNPPGAGPEQITITALFALAAATGSGPAGQTLGGDETRRT